MAPAAGLLLGGRDLAARRCGAEEAEEDVPAEWDMSPEDQAAAQAVLDEEKIEDRRYLLEQMARNIPQWLDKIKRRVAERFENRRKAA